MCLKTVYKTKRNSIFTKNDIIKNYNYFKECDLGFPPFLFLD